MRPIPFVKSTSATASTTNTDSLSTNNTNNDADLGIQVAGIYASIISSTSSTAATIDHHRRTKAKNTKSISDDNISTEAPIYCASCDFVVRDPAHFHGTAHLVSTQSAPPQPQHQQQPQQKEKEKDRSTQQSQDTSSVGITRMELAHGKDRAVQLMKKQGWRYGHGLGKTNQGAPYPVTTVWKQDRLGIGHPRTDRRRITHPSISKSRSNNGNSNSNTLKNPGLVKGKQLAADAKAESAQRAAILHYMNH